MSSPRAAWAGLAVLVAGLAACAPHPQGKARVVEPGPSPGSLEWAIAGDWRTPEEKARDQWRHPLATLRFFDLTPNAVVLEAYPGAGWYSAILAPYLKEGGGRLIAAGFDPAAADPAQTAVLAAYKKRFGGRSDLFGTVAMSIFDAQGGRACRDGEADLALTFRNVHTWMAAGWAENAFLELYRCLKPGGVLGVVEHRADPLGEQDPRASDGYVQVAYVRQIAEEAGFVFVDSAEINANSADNKDHPFGVWTLPPVLQTAPFGAPPDPNFDSAPFRAIGESDRMTLKFRKPMAGDQPKSAAVTPAPARR